MVTEKVKAPGDLIRAAQFSEAEARAAESAAVAVDFTDVGSLILYGTTELSQLSTHLDSFIEHLDASETGMGTDLNPDIEAAYALMKVTQFKERMQGVGPGVLGRLRGALSLPALLQHLADNRDKLMELLGAAQAKALARQRSVIAGDIRINAMRQQYDALIKSVAVRLAGGEAALLSGAAEYERRYRHLETGQADDVEPARLRDLANNIRLFEKRLLQMREAYDRSLTMTLPMIESIRQAGKSEVGNNIDAIIAAIPRLKEIVIRVSSLSDEQLKPTHLRQLTETADGLVGAASQEATSGQSSAEKRHLAASELAEVKSKLT